MIGHPALSYQMASARGASPIGQVVSLYDTILRDFVRALAALQGGDVESRVFELNHALLVIAYLQSVLNHERGGEPAKQFDLLYAVTRARIVEANIRATPDSLEELINLYGSLRQAWYQAGQQLAADEQQAHLSATPDDPAATQAPNSANNDVETPKLHWTT